MVCTLYTANTMLFQCWAGVEDSGPTLKQHWVNASCLLVIYRCCKVHLYKCPSRHGALKQCCFYVVSASKRWPNIKAPLFQCIVFARVVYTLYTANTMLFQCWATVEDGGPTLKQHWVNSSYFLVIYRCCTVHFALEVKKQ